MSSIRKTTTILSMAILLGFGACGGDDDDESDGGASVRQLTLDSSILSIGASSVVRLEFTFSADDVFDDDENVVVLVRLPPSVTLQGGTSELKRPIDDRSVEPQVFACGDGGALIQFDLDEDDLLDAGNPSGDADAEIRFTVDAVRASENGVVTATAGNNVFAGGCDTPFVVQRSAAVVVR